MSGFGPQQMPPIRAGQSWQLQNQMPMPSFQPMPNSMYSAPQPQIQPMPPLPAPFSLGIQQAAAPPAAPAPSTAPNPTLLPGTPEYTAFVNSLGGIGA